jgi:hypothetical protein
VTTPQRLELGREYPSPDEAAQADEIARLFAAMIRRKYPPGTRPSRRDAHTKAHGLLRAEFTVLGDLPERARVGLFATPRTYEAWIRFSNAFTSVVSDTEPDVKGMAVKVMGVDGEKLLEREKDAKTQDFLMISTDIFFSPNTTSYVEFTREYIKNENPVRWLLRPPNWRQAYILYRASRKVIENPLTTRFWSSVPFMHGSAAVKYSAMPLASSGERRGTSPNYLREAMVAHLQHREAVFDFGVQFQTDAARMPVEDPSVSWDERVSPFVRVARIRIPPQVFDTPAQNVYAENLSFTPWHALPEHRPIGGINRTRKSVYEAAQKLRHETNGTPRHEPSSFADFDNSGRV